MFVTRFSAIKYEGIVVPKLELLGDSHSVAYLLAQAGVAPQIMPPDELVNITPPYSTHTNNIYMVTTGPGEKPESAVLHMMPRTDRTVNIVMGSDGLDLSDRLTSEGKSYVLPGDASGFPLVGHSKDGVRLHEFITVMELEHIEALGRLAAYANQ